MDVQVAGRGDEEARPGAGPGEEEVGDTGEAEDGRVVVG